MRIKSTARRVTTFGLAGATAAVGLVGVSAGTASAAPSDLAKLRACESGGNYNTNTGNGYYGAYQFDQSTWRSVGGSGSPQNASPAEQDAAASRLYAARGNSPWPVCGRGLNLSGGGSGSSSASSSDSSSSSSSKSSTAKRSSSSSDDSSSTSSTAKRSSSSSDDSSSASSSTSKKSSGSSSSSSSSSRSNAGSPASGVLSIDLVNEKLSSVRTLQKNLNSEGADLAVDGQFGPLTEAAVKSFQKKNGLSADGVVGSQTQAAL